MASSWRISATNCLSPCSHSLSLRTEVHLRWPISLSPGTLLLLSPSFLLSSSLAFLYPGLCVIDCHPDVSDLDHRPPGDSSSVCFISVQSRCYIMCCLQWTASSSLGISRHFSLRGSVVPESRLTASQILCFIYLKLFFVYSIYSSKCMYIRPTTGLPLLLLFLRFLHVFNPMKLFLFFLIN